MSIKIRFFLFLVFLILSVKTAFADEITCADLTGGKKEETIKIEWVDLKESGQGEVDLDSLTSNKLWKKYSSKANRKFLIEVLMEQKTVHTSDILRRAIRSASEQAETVRFFKAVLDADGEDGQLNLNLSDDYGLTLYETRNSYALDQNEVSIVNRGRVPIKKFEKIESAYVARRELLDENLFIISTVLDLAEIDFLDYEFSDEEKVGPRGVEYINILRYAVRHADIDVLLFIVNHERFKESQNFEQGKALLVDIYYNKHVAKEDPDLVYDLLTPEASKKHKRFGQKFLKFFRRW